VFFSGYDVVHSGRRFLVPLDGDLAAVEGTVAHVAYFCIAPYLHRLYTVFATSCVSSMSGRALCRSFGRTLCALPYRHVSAH
jgi:hypothetical protein